MKIFESNYGAEYGHMHVGVVLTNLGNAELALGENIAARSHLLRTLEIFEQTIGTDHVTTAEALRELGYASGRLGEVSTMKAHAGFTPNFLRSMSV